MKKIIGKLLSSNMYLLYEDGIADCWLVDIGDFSALSETLPCGINVKGVFLTHSHFDHMAGVNGLCRLFPHCKVFTSEYGKESLYSEKKNFSFYHEQPVTYKSENVTVLHDGEIINIFDDVPLHVIATPGHCPSCLSYYTDEIVFTGDSFIPDVPVVTKLPKGNRTLAAESTAKILKLAETRKIFAGHDKNKWKSPF